MDWYKELHPLKYDAEVIKKQEQILSNITTVSYDDYRISEIFKHIKQLIIKGLDMEVENQISIKSISQNFIKNYKAEKDKLGEELLFVDDIFKDCQEVSDDICLNGEQRIIFYINSENANKKRFANMILELIKK